MRPSGKIPSRSGPARAERWVLIWLLFSAFLFVAAAVAILVTMERRGELSPLRSSIATLICLLGIVQGAIALDVKRKQGSAHRDAISVGAGSLFPRFCVAFIRWMAVGAVLDFALVASVGSPSQRSWLFAAGLAIWYTMAWLPLWPRRRAQACYQRLLQSRAARRIGRFAAAMVFAALVAEAGLRGYSAWFGRSLVSSRRPESQAAAPDHAHFLGDPLPPFQIDVLTTRGAPLRRPIELSRQLEELVPGTRVALGASSPGATLRDACEQTLATAGQRPSDLVLLFLAPDEDLTRDDDDDADWFVWNQSQLARALCGAWRGSADRAESSSGDSDASAPNADSASAVERHLVRCERRLSAYRTPLEEPMRQRWNALERDLAAALQAHRRAGVPLAIVFVPSEFQIQRHLCDAARKRLGWENHEIDLDLPRRRLTAFAAGHDLPLYDLSPGLEQGETPPFARNSSEWNSDGLDRVAVSLGRWLHAHYGTQIASASHAKTR